MAGDSAHEVTALLQAWRGGDQAALDRLMPAIYAELHRLAHSYMRRERPDHTLQIPTPQVSQDTVFRNWRLAKAWLMQQLKAEG